MATSSAPTRSRVLTRRRSVGASTTSIDSRTSSAPCSSQSAALPCGSLSIRVTDRFPPAETAERYTAVVVLPTPPFNAATTKITSGTIARSGRQRARPRLRARSSERRTVARELGAVVAEHDLAGDAAPEVGSQGDDEPSEVVGFAEPTEWVRVDQRRDLLVG